VTAQADDRAGALPSHDAAPGSPAARGPLVGLSVLEAGQVIAAPFAGSILADLGADVVKIERPDGGDDARRMGAAFRHGDSLNYHLFNRSKQSVALDLKLAEQRERFEAMVAGADIFIHNLRPGVTRGFDIDGAALCARHPRLIYCEISGFGFTGPMKMQPGYEPLIQAFSGLSSTNGGPDDPPTRVGASVCDQGAGMWAVIGVLAMLRQREFTGRGGVVQTSLLETAMVWNGQKGDALVNEGRMPERHASGHPGFAPYEAFDTADAPLLICCGNDRLFAKLGEVLERRDWIDDPRFATNRARLKNKPALFEQLVPLLRARPRAAWIAAMTAAGVPCAPIHSLADALADPQVEALHLRLPVPGENFSLTGLPLTFDAVRLPIRAVAPRLGQHNASYGLPEVEP
jgi:formyl-CoA transferase